MTATEHAALDSSGYLVLERFLAPEMLEQVRGRVEELHEQEGENAGAEFRKEPGSRRLANLVDKGEVFERLIAMPEILDEQILRGGLSPANISLVAAAGAVSR